jgi:hypothetical protein
MSMFTVAIGTSHDLDFAWVSLASRRECTDPLTVSANPTIPWTNRLRRRRPWDRSKK